MSEGLKLDEDDLETILAIGNNEQSGRVTNFELKELVRVYREYSSSQARLSEAVKVLEEIVYATQITRASAGDLRKGFASYVSPSSWVEQLQCHIDQSLSKAKAFLATIGEENE